MTQEFKSGLQPGSYVSVKTVGESETLKGGKKITFI